MTEKQKKKKTLDKFEIEKLVEARHKAGIYSLKEICYMYADPVTGKPMSRFSIDNAMNSGELEYMSPNNRDRYIDIENFKTYMSKNSNVKGVIHLINKNRTVALPEKLNNSSKTKNA